MSTLRILIADDHPLVRATLAAYLRSHDGVEVVAEVTNGSAAVEATMSCRPDVVLMDQRMPERNGLDATDAIKTAMPDARVYVMSFTTDLHCAGYARAVSVDGFIDKRTLKQSVEAMLVVERSLAKKAVAETEAA